MRPPVLCATARGAAKEIARSRERANGMVRPHNEGNREKNSRAFMNSPLATKMLEERIFAVAVPRKPYYNPANLEKVGSCVKQKEFIRRISRAAGNAVAAHQRGGSPGWDFFFCSAGLGGARPGNSTTHAKPL